MWIAKAAITLLCLVVIACAKRICMEDSDCEDLGDLYCIKGACPWGICSCPFGKAAKYLGSNQLFQCVPLKKVGEKCSTSGAEGICAAPSSYCDQESDNCKCAASNVPIWGGERCAPATSLVAGETCSSSLGSCDSNSQCQPTYPVQTGPYWNSELSSPKPCCSCENSQTLRISNSHQESSFLDRKRPFCGEKQIGDRCLQSSDCPRKAKCDGNVCKCIEGTVPNYYGSSCKMAQSRGQTCLDQDDMYHCNGDQGLICGDICEVDPDAMSNNTCVCGPWHISSASGCTPRSIGSKCYGDSNCKGINDNAICKDGECQNVAVAVQMSFGLWILVSMVSFSHRLQ